MPLRNELKRMGHGYKIYNKNVSYLFYMDDLKPYSEYNNKLEGLLYHMKVFNNDIRIECGLDKITFQQGKLKTSNLVGLYIDTIIKEIELEQTYK